MHNFYTITVTVIILSEYSAYSVYPPKIIECHLIKTESVTNDPINMPSPWKFGFRITIKTAEIYHITKSYIHIYKTLNISSCKLEKP